MPNNNRWKAVQEQVVTIVAGGLDAEEAALELLEAQRRQERFVCYWEPHGEQQKFWEQLTPEQDLWLLLGGNSAGKSDLGEWLVAVWLLGKEYFRGEKNWKWVERLPLPKLPISIRGVGLTSDELRDPMWEKLMGSTEHPPFIPPDMIKHVNRQEFTIKLKNGSKFHGKSSDVDPKTHGGPSLDLVHIDEECKFDIFKENQRRIRKHGGKLLVTATPLDDVGTIAQPWIFDTIEKWRAGDSTIGIIFMAMEGNPHLDPEFIRREKHRLAGMSDEMARLYGIPTRRSGLYYKNWRSQPPLWVPAYNFVQRGFRAVMIDPAVTGTVGALWAYFDQRGKMTLYRAYKAANKTVSQHVEAILTENRGDPINLWYADPWMSRQKVPDALSKEQHKTVLQVWRDAGLPRLQIPDIQYDVCLARSHEYIKAAADPTDPHPPLEVFDHLSAFEDEITRYVIDSVAQGPNRGELRDKPRKGRDGSSTLMECFQYLAGLGLRSRPLAEHRVVRPGTTNYFGSPAPRQVPAPKGFDEAPW